MTARVILPAAAVVAMLAAASPGAAQTASLQAGLDLYAAAAYDDALTALDAVRGASLSTDDRVTLDQHRMLCLLALGRVEAAEAAATSLLQTRPAFVLSANEVSPRVRAMFDATRRRALPALVRQRYADAKTLFETGQTAEAHAAFASLETLLDDPAVAEADGAFADLRVLVSGFRQLSGETAARAAEPAPVAPLPTPLTFGVARAPGARVTSSTAILSLVPPSAAAMHAPQLDDAPDSAAPALATPEAAAPSATPPPFTPLDIFTYDWRDKNVQPPVAIAQPVVQGWWGSMGEPPVGTALGAVDVLVDESGRVLDARIYRTVNRVYDAVLVASARQWRYQPAMKDGRAVKYRRITGVVSGR